MEDKVKALSDSLVPRGSGPGLGEILPHHSAQVLIHFLCYWQVGLAAISNATEICRDYAHRVCDRLTQPSQIAQDAVEQCIGPALNPLREGRRDQACVNA